MREVCVDASFALKLVLPEAKSDLVQVHYASWLRDGVAVIAPWLWMFESHAVLRRKVYKKELTDLEAREAWRVLRRQGIRTVHPRGLFEHAWELAMRLGRPTTYDAVYLAVAELRGCELWTADERLGNAVAGKLAWVWTV